MQRRSIAVLAALAVVAVAPAALGAGDEANNQAASGIAWLILMAPAVLFFAFLVVFVRRSASRQQSYAARAVKHIDLQSEHMVRIERKTDRMIELLESIDRKLSEGS